MCVCARVYVFGTGTHYIIIYYSVLSARDRQKHLLAYTLDCVPLQVHCTRIHSQYSHTHAYTHIIYTYVFQIVILPERVFIYIYLSIYGYFDASCIRVLSMYAWRPCIRYERKLARKTYAHKYRAYTVYTLSAHGMDTDLCYTHTLTYAYSVESRLVRFERESKQLRIKCFP